MKHILHDSYAQLCDIQWDTGQLLPTFNAERTKPVVAHVPTDHIAEFFDLIKSSSRKFIVVSSNSDYCIEYQEKTPVEHDMQKWLRFIDCKGLSYNTLCVPARCNLETCRKSDTYSVKMYSWTKDTFTDIPENVLMWFGTNINIQDERVVHIPFGVPEQSLPYLAQNYTKEKFGIYCNWQTNTVDRGYLKKMLSEWPQVTVEDQVSAEQFINQIKAHPFIISPPGNGLDCYRTLEAIYCGSIPVVVNDEWSRCYDKLPVIKTDSYNGIFDNLVAFWEQTWPTLNVSLDNTPADWYYWERVINEAKETL